MIRGRVVVQAESLVGLVGVRLRGSTGIEDSREFIVDAGFDGHLTLPSALIEALELRNVDTIRERLGNEISAFREVFECKVLWHERWQRVLMQSQDSEETPLMGMAMLKGSSLTPEANEDGDVLIEPLDVG